MTDLQEWGTEVASEELEQRYPSGIGDLLGAFEVFETQLVTLNQYAEHGIIPAVAYGEYKTQKCDSIVIERKPALRVIAIGEAKQPGFLTAANWKGIAKNLLVKKLKPTGALLGYVTDGVSTYWINGASDDVVEVTRQDGKAMPSKIDFKNEAFAADLAHIALHLNPDIGTVVQPSKADPATLAREIWQTVWRLKADRPEDCLATFVEIFIYKFLDDLGLMTTNDDGISVGFKHLLNNIPSDKSFTYYAKQVRTHIKALFPPGADGYSLINGIVLRSENRDHNIIFNEILNKFERFGSLRNTNPEFKTRLYESFLQESRTTTDFGQHFTPRKVVAAVQEMAGVAGLSAGREICDPASGVGGFVLEQMAHDLDSQWTVDGDDLTPTQHWHAYEIVAKTAILAKANALVHCGDLLAHQPSRVPSFAKWLNEVFVCKEKTSLGALEDMSKQKYDMILTNPPFVVSGSADIAKLVKRTNTRAKYFGRKYSGVEGLFVQYIVQALKSGGDAWVLLPETFFLRTTDRQLRKWMLENCTIDLLAVLPERTFFNTPKRVVIAHLKKRKTALAPGVTAKAVLEQETTLLYAATEIGETRDAKRFPERSDLPELVQCYRTHAAGLPVAGVERAATVKSADIYDTKSVNIRHYWDHQVARKLGLVGQEEDPAERRIAIDRRIDAMSKIVAEWEETKKALVAPDVPTSWRRVRLGDANLFSLRIGKRVLKKDVYKSGAAVPLYSANIRKPFGFVAAANAGGLEHGGALWSIDSDFDCRGISAGAEYAITDHCGQITILDPEIDPGYLAAQVRQAGVDHGFNREFRPSLGLIQDLEIELPQNEDGTLDRDTMEAWSQYRDELDRIDAEFSALLA
ncbi:SAM-dependent DNA methyltransferase [Brevundimonas sp. AJA228-03]|uniref:HsdM family class I SAM-dependent methyltransferase n=1 Tax=Brevundimonas sp. AJA228-03 TaxID=2752515 RepID=UPI001ADF4FF9|nr:N-6 DNA methylase [Brevundimonas sp. AJA228-03]QTN20046.1 SAM-dependent DNA methyltransferase [Brevundimonas sp. AJA228-03]